MFVETYQCVRPVNSCGYNIAFYGVVDMILLFCCYDQFIIDYNN